MSSGLAILQTEHRRYSAVLHCLDNLIREAEETGRPPDFELLHAILDYVGQFLDRFHHPKEDEFLFPLLKKRCPDAKRLLADLARQHLEGYTMMAELGQLLESYELDGEGAFAAFRDATRAYIDFERAHLKLEEQKVLPLARRYLTEADRARIDAAFTANQDPLFGEARRREFQALYTTIVQLAPEPYGLARRKPRDETAGR